MITIKDVEEAIANKMICVLTDQNNLYIYRPTNPSVENIHQHLSYINRDPIVNLYTYFNKPEFKPYKQAYINMLKDLLFRKQLGIGL